MSLSFMDRKRIRKSFGTTKTVAQMPNLIEVQMSSYADFLQTNVAPKERKDVGLQTVFKSIFPVHDFAGKGDLEFVKYELDKPKYDVDECIKRGLTFSAPVRATLRLIVWDVDDETGARSIRDIKEQDVYMGDLPMMTSTGTFVVNGTERVVVSQMHRSPGVFFDHDEGKNTSGRYLFSSRIIPYRGSWLDFEFDAKDLVYVRIDRRRKLPITTLLYALDSADTAKARAKAAKAGKNVDFANVYGMSKEEILSSFYDKVSFTREKKGWSTEFIPERMKGVKLAEDLVDADTKKAVMEKGEKILIAKAKKLQKDGLKRILVNEEHLVGMFAASDMIDETTGEIMVEAGDEITAEILATFDRSKVKEFDALYIDYVNVGPYLRNTLAADRNSTREEALIDIYKVMRPGEPPTVETADILFRSMFFDNDRYDLSAVGRVKMNARLGFSDADVPDSERILRKEDILAIVKILLNLKDGRGHTDDIDNLGNRRVRSVGELMENQYRIGLLRMERSIRERMSSIEIDTIMPHDLINAKPLSSAVREFFASSQLSQFMDQNNPLSEVTHKRRLSALGPGGLTRERASFEVRDVHPTHYGRICPIETPEGQNIGLINSLATYARINQYGFIESPYRKVVNGKPTDEIIYMSAMEEAKYTIAQANAHLDETGKLVSNEMLTCRRDGDVLLAKSSEVDFMDVSPKQLVSVAAALIPFLENDDANRALMGSNMQRQGVPLLQSTAPLVGTGMEAQVAKDSGASVLAKRDGVVSQVDATRIVIKATGEVDATTSAVDIYTLMKFQRSNTSTCMTQRPLVKVGDIVHKGDIIADGPSIDLGELALGRNVLVAFMPWNGYNFEDSILISERIARDDVFTSIHIDEFEVMSRDTKLGPEEISRDIPNVGEEALKQLDETGVVYIGAEVKAGDILVGKVTPKGETVMTPEEKLLRTIFGEKAADVRDTSLRVPPGIQGTVVDVRVFTRRGLDKDERALSIEQAEIDRLTKDRNDERKILQGSYMDRVKALLVGHKIAKSDVFKEGSTIKDADFDALSVGHYKKISVSDDKIMKQIEQLTETLEQAEKALQAKFENRVEKAQRGDEMLPGVLKTVKVFIAVKRKLQPGDKMAGRHGNKGVVSRVLPIEDMPYTEDGTPMDLVLNPLGVPSRMNVGQILETHLGYACHALGAQIGQMLDAVKRSEKTVKHLRSKLDEVYDDADIKKDMKALSDDEVLELAGNVKNGLPIATPVFDGAHEGDINAMLQKAGLPTSGQVTLYDGLTGEPFDRPVTIGYIYMLKLHHLVDEKIHARSIGAYSLVTQQPLGGKAQFGGQRFGEMEVWALEAYGAAYTLQEMLTVKSDDVSGRTKVYETLVRGDDNFESGIPESFNVLVKEMRSLCLDVELNQKEV